MEKLSVIIATINDSIATNLTIAQILVQLERDRMDYEIIVVDNGSEEIEKMNLHEFIRFHKDFPISYHKYPIQGTIPPHSYGVTVATGKYITMPDPHLIFSPSYFRTMIDSLNNLGAKVVFSPFGVGCITKRDGEYICESHLISPNPFGRVNSIGRSCLRDIPPFPIPSNTLSGFVAEKDWMMKIGNLFPEAFEKSGGHTAESLMLGLTTWMFGGKCWAEPSAVIDHPMYRNGHGGGRNANMCLSMATGAYILGGQKYLDDMEYNYGKFVAGDLEEIPAVAYSARKYVIDNAKYTLDELVNNWEQIKNES